MLQKILTSTQDSSSVAIDITDALHRLMDISRNVVTAMEQVNVMTDDITGATNNQKVNTGQINKAVGEINEMASQIQKAAKQRLNGVHQLIDTTNDFTGLIVQNLASSKSIADATAALSSQVTFYCAQSIGLNCL